MRIRYIKPDGAPLLFELGDRPITIGRSPDADIIVLDEKASRIHCGVRLWDGEFYLKDLKSKNGTYLNDRTVEVSKIRHGDVIRIGESLLFVESEEEIGTDTAMGEIGGQMDMGKGYSTILRQIVQEVPGDNAAAPSVAPAPEVPEEGVTEAPPAPAPSTSTGRKPVRITIRRPPGKAT